MKVATKLSRVLFCLSVLFWAVCGLSAAETGPGVWKQTSSTAGDCADCTIMVEKMTSHIVHLEASNGWVGFAYYDADKDAYRGFFELTKMAAGTPANWVNRVFMIELVMERMTLNIEGESGDITFSATYRKK